MGFPFQTKVLFATLTALCMGSMLWKLSIYWNDSSISTGSAMLLYLLMLLCTAPLAIGWKVLVEYSPRPAAEEEGSKLAL